MHKDNHSPLKLLQLSQHEERIDGNGTATSLEDKYPSMLVAIR